MLCVAVLQFHCYQTSLNVGQHTVFLFLPLAFILAGETSTKHAVHSSSLSSSAHSRCSINLWRRACSYSSLIFIQTLYARWLSKQFPRLMDLLCSWVNADLVVCTQETRRRTMNIFSLIHINWRASVSVSVSVCTNRLCFALEKRKVVTVCVIVFWEHCISVHSLFVGT